MRKFVKPVAVGLLLYAAVALASSIKTFSGSTALQVSDLNSNFSHIHNTMVGGHGARLVDADVNAGAAIAHSKLATPALVPKAYASDVASSSAGSSVCTCNDGDGATTCNLGDSFGIASIKSGGVAGSCKVTLTNAMADTRYLAIAQSHTLNVYCYLAASGGVMPFATTAFQTVCRATSTNVDTNAIFSVLILGN